MAREPVDTIRAVGVVYIVLFWHLMTYVGTGANHTNKATHLATISILAAFTFLSGRLLGEKTLAMSVDIRAFYGSRFTRAYVPFVIASLLFYASGIYTGIDFLRCITLIGSFSTPYPLTLWYVSMILIFYSVTPVLSIFASRLEVKLYAAITIILSIFIYTASLYVLPIDPRMAIYFPCFAFGIFMGKHRLEVAQRTRLAWIALATIVSMTLCQAVPTQTWESSFLSMPFAATSSLLLFSASTATSHRMGNIKIIHLLSEASFFMYLFHRPIYAASLHIISKTSENVVLAFLLFLVAPAIFAFSLVAQRAYNYAISCVQPVRASTVVRAPCTTPPDPS